jgi:hypothetical protein
MLPSLMLGLRESGEHRACNPQTPGPAAFKVPAAPAGPPSLGPGMGTTETGSFSPGYLLHAYQLFEPRCPFLGGWWSGWTVFQLPLPGQPPRLPQARSEGQRRERRVTATKAAGTVGAGKRPLPASTTRAAAVAAGASPPPAPRAQCATAPPRSRFQDPLRVDSAARGSASLRAGAGRGLTCQSRFIKPIRTAVAGPGPNHRPIG